MTESLYWTGLVTRCEISRGEFNGVMYDAKIPGGGWALLNEETFKYLGCALGVGLGQRYEKQDNGRWLCTAGSAKHAVILSSTDKKQIANEASLRKRGL